MDLDLVIQGGTVVTEDGVLQADVGVRQGRISAVGRGLNGQAVVSAQGLLVLPGAVDACVHLDDPSPAERPGAWRAGTQAAACGGTTTVMDIVTPRPGERLTAACAERRAAAEGQSGCDYALRLTLPQADPLTLSQVTEVVAEGIPSFQMYTTGAEYALSDAALLDAFTAICAAGGLAVVHAESDAILSHRLGRLVRDGRLTPRDFRDSRPPEAEVEAIQRVITLADATGVSLYLGHVSTAESLDTISRARRQGRPVFGETCPQYLLIDESVFSSRDPRVTARFVCDPPLRTAWDRKALWDGLRGRALHCVSTDHYAYQYQGQKDRGLHDFREIPMGLPGVETRLALLYTFGVRSGRLTMEQWVRLCCTNPASLFGLLRKGRLAIGADADLVLFDPEWRRVIEHKNLHEQVDYTPYEGQALRGWPRHVFLRGQQVVQDGEPIPGALPGQFVPGVLANRF